MVSAIAVYFVFYLILQLKVYFHVRRRLHRRFTLRRRRGLRRHLRRLTRRQRAPTSTATSTVTLAQHPVTTLASTLPALLHSSWILIQPVLRQQFERIWSSKPDEKYSKWSDLVTIWSSSPSTSNQSKQDKTIKDSSPSKESLDSTVLIETDFYTIYDEIDLMIEKVARKRKRSDDDPKHIQVHLNGHEHE